MSNIDQYGSLDMWVIYKHPKDYPEDYVLRRWSIRPGVIEANSEVFVAKCAAALRVKIPKSAVRVGPSPGDDPVISEVWV